ncbi:MAG: YedE family putative selenium transporter [Sphaerochaetaceae bacterium]|jgi:YedE family putative selenium metabolism protein
MSITKEKKVLAVTGVFVGLGAGLLVLWGNPQNMGFCIACFIRDIAGSLHLHGAGAVQYMRPEIPAMVLGAFILSMARGEFQPRGGSSPMLRFLFGFTMMVGALVFLGCPLRMMLRLGAGDLNALVGLLGFAAGVWVGTLFLNRGFSLGRSQNLGRLEGTSFSGLQIVLLILLVAFPTLLVFSKAGAGPGAMHAPIIASLLIGLVVGAFAQRSRLCMAGGIRDLILFGDSTLITAPIFIFLFTLIWSLATGTFHLSFAGQPVAHTSSLWNFLGMTVVGLSAVLLGGCPLRQLILAGEGNTDSALTVLGMTFGAAIAHGFSLASSGKGPTTNGKVMTLVCLAFLVICGVIMTKRGKEHA